MGRKKKKQMKPWCWYCNREFEDEKILMQHQRAKHFKCHICHKKLYSGPGLAIHCVQVHKETVDAVPNSLPGRADIELEIYGMEGIPEKDLKEHERQKIADEAAEAGGGAAGPVPKKPKTDAGEGTSAQPQGQMPSPAASMAPGPVPGVPPAMQHMPGMPMMPPPMPGMMPGQHGAPGMPTHMGMPPMVPGMPPMMMGMPPRPGMPMGPMGPMGMGVPPGMVPPMHGHGMHGPGGPGGMPPSSQPHSAPPTSQPPSTSAQQMQQPPAKPLFPAAAPTTTSTTGPVGADFKPLNAPSNIGPQKLPPTTTAAPLSTSAPPNPTQTRQATVSAAPSISKPSTSGGSTGGSTKLMHPEPEDVSLEERRAQMPKYNRQMPPVSVHAPASTSAPAPMGQPHAAPPVSAHAMGPPGHGMAPPGHAPPFGGNMMPPGNMPPNMRPPMPPPMGHPGKRPSASSLTHVVRTHKGRSAGRVSHATCIPCTPCRLKGPPVYRVLPVDLRDGLYTVYSL
ncbi:BUB3-interacting and GLEBS motif-containing protein ZNF207-like isoform X2 [Branchiostoma floridae]|uniref:BUB3-interacting and GLEBS motif-containing protein ZNF207-like isoform X1 n=1 Tax=Branchiostoma floridae TaxID=7739 RepID=A0A9J7M9S3_BRAFL|nr:BUB3-interacting and GLEBS motif-containing protein ZNF207-like isoform X1 [Branchiostoma floridae]XP_035696180.1 BUB3-interacting and GLEBS motif-containing protein ZNF207-like isoform X2 [Branchiostoma floridae]